MAKSSNEKRALLKQQCREALAAHIRLSLIHRQAAQSRMRQSQLEPRSNHRERELVQARTGIVEAMQLLQAHLLQNQDTASKDDTPETGPVAIEIADTT
ncbi:hypothetical protein N7513_001866 [Penicillium frequentans]|nr:hypothetical protein N7513_001866 [Penicillium glabrum]